MMLPTPGMTAWSRRTSQSILPLWFLTASSDWLWLNLGEQTSRLSIALTLCSQSSVNLQARNPVVKDEFWKRMAAVTASVPQGHCCSCEVTHLKIVSFMYSAWVYLLWDGAAEVKFSNSWNKCASVCLPEQHAEDPRSQWTGQMSSQTGSVFHATIATVFRRSLM